MDLSVLILAAGCGKRMRSATPKVLHPLGGRPLLSYPLELAKSLHPKKIVVLIGHQAERVRETFAKERVEWAIQPRQLGTAHAVLCGLEPLREFRGLLLILSGDVPLLKKETLEGLKKVLLEKEGTLALLTTRLEEPTGYGRIVRSDSGEIQRIVEEVAATEEERRICEINTGVYLAQVKDLFDPLRRVKKSLAKGEYFLTDLVEHFVREGKRVVSSLVADPAEVMGINSRRELAASERVLRRRICEDWMRRGVTMIDPDSVFIEEGVAMESDVTLHPGVVLRGETRIGAGTEILPYSVVTDSMIGGGCRIGPFAHLRPGTVVEDGGHVGNFVEMKKSRLGEGAKANHLAYLGDAEIGARTNIGAGTITCNYDGQRKHRTVIGAGSFVGSDTQFVAPVKVGKGAWIGAGTTVTKDVPAGALAVSRVEQKNILDWARNSRKKK